MRISVINVGEKKRFFPKLFIFTMSFISLCIWVIIKIQPLIMSVAKGYGENVVANTLSEMVKKELEEYEYNFADVIYTAEGRVSSIGIDSNDLNLFMADIVLRLKDSILEMEAIEAGIPLGNFLSNPFFSGLGPKVPVKFLILTNTNVTAEEKFTAKGINQTLYVVNLIVDTEVGIYIPGMRGSMTVTNIVPVLQYVIVGEVPDSYTNVEGMEGTIQDTVLDIE